MSKIKPVIDPQEVIEFAMDQIKLFSPAGQIRHDAITRLLAAHELMDRYVWVNPRSARWIVTQAFDQLESTS